MNGFIDCLVGFEGFDVSAWGAVVEGLGFLGCEGVGDEDEDPCCWDLEGC